MKKKSLIAMVVMSMMFVVAGCGTKEKTVSKEPTKVTQDQKETGVKEDAEDTFHAEVVMNQNSFEECESDGIGYGILFKEFEPTEEMYMSTFHNPEGYKKSKFFFAEKMIFKLPEDESMYKMSEIEVISPTEVYLSDDYEVFFETDAYKGSVLAKSDYVFYYIANKYTEWGILFNYRVKGGTAETQQAVKLTFEKALEESLKGSPAPGAAPELQEIVKFEDDDIAGEVRDVLGIQAVGYRPLRVMDLLYVTNLELGSFCDSLNDLRYMKNLESVSLSFMNSEYDLSPLADLPNLKKIDFCYMDLTGLDALGTITTLTELQLGNCKIQDISAFGNLTNLTSLSLQGNEIRDISALANLTNLIRLDLQDNKITDISALADFTNLTELYLSGNQITDVSALKDLSKLENLTLWENKITDFSPVEFVPNKEW